MESPERECIGCESLRVLASHICEETEAELGEMLGETNVPTPTRLEGDIAV